MKHPRRKLIVSVLVMSALLVALTFGFARVHFLANAKDFDRETALKMHGLLMTIDNLIETQDRVTKDYVTQLTQSLDLITLPLRDIVDTEGDGAIRRYENGLVLRRDGDELVLPEDVSGLPLLEAQTPEGKAWFAMQSLMGVSLVGLLLSLRSEGQQGVVAVIAYVLNGQWTFGYNLFALTRIVILLLMMTLTLLTLKLLIGLLGGALDTKGETVCHLVESLLRYVVIITGAFFIFQSLGFDTPTLLASLGIFSLAISLASKDLVADVLSGIIIVFSGEYQIGEIVEIAGFRGRVAEIGVRSTTLVSKEGNVKYMSNRNVSDVINLSRLNTHCIIQIGVACGQSLEKIEALIERELPDIGKRVRGIVGDPVYRGVTGLSAGSLLLSFSAECSEEDYVSVRRDLNSQIIRLLDENGVSLR